MKMVLFFLFFYSKLMAETTIMPVGNISSSNPNVSSDSALTRMGGLALILRCYGTNNRGTTNPLSPNSTLFIGVDNKNTTEKFLIEVPSKILTTVIKAPLDCFAHKIDATKMTEVFLPASETTFLATLAQIKTAKNGVAFKCPTGFIKSTDHPEPYLDYLLNAGYTYLFAVATPQTVAAPVAFKEISNANIVAQSAQSFGKIIPASEFYGRNGLMSDGTKHDIKAVSNTDSYGNTQQGVQITIDYPGQDGFCGGYHSPLMLFFTDKFPHFTGTTKLINPEKETYWVEENHEGYFLVALENKNSEITNNNLFGNGGSFKDGFEKLKSFDSNNDSSIDSKDKIFKNLFLWKDQNANGKNDPNEISTLSSMNVTKLNLDYSKTFKAEINSRAIAKGKGLFHFKQKKKAKEGIILDIYFNETGKTN